MDWSSILNQIIQALLPILLAFITGMATYIANKLKTVYETKLNNETAKTVVNDVVKFVQQVYGDLNGPERLQKAIQQASTILEGKGITLTETEINMLIESAVYGIKQANGETLVIPEAKETVEVDVKEENGQG